MRRLWLAAILGLIGSVLFTTPTDANRLYPARWSYNGGSDDIAYIVEQQTPCLPDGTHCGATNPDPSAWVTNTTGCIWDPDDQKTADVGRLGEYLDPGEATTGGWCMLVDTAEHLHALYVPLAGTAGTLRIGDYFSLDVPAGHRGCIVGPWFSTFAGLPPVPDSNGGVGERIDVTFTLRSVSSRRVRNVWADARVAYAGFAPVSPCTGWPWYAIGTRVEVNGAQLWWWVE